MRAVSDAGFALCGGVQHGNLSLRRHDIVVYLVLSIILCRNNFRPTIRWVLLHFLYDWLFISGVIPGVYNSCGDAVQNAPLFRLFFGVVLHGGLFHIHPRVHFSIRDVRWYY